LEIVGEWAPSVLAATSALIVSSVGSEKCKTKKGCFAAKAGSFIPAMGLMAYASSKTAEYLDYSLGGFAGRMMFAAFSFAITAILYLLVGKIPPDIKKKLFLPTAYTLAASIAVLLTVSTLKTVWGRTRLRDMVEGNSLDAFTPWYKPNFFGGAYSFPSGHTAHATLVLMISTWLSGKAEKCILEESVISLDLVSSVYTVSAATLALAVPDILLYGDVTDFIALANGKVALYAPVHGDGTRLTQEEFSSMQQASKSLAESSGTKCTLEFME
jgi:membrane-associated phospholipid phosphatase